MGGTMQACPPGRSGVLAAAVQHLRHACDYAAQTCWSNCQRNTPGVPNNPLAASANCNEVTKLCGAAGCGAQLITKKFAKAKGEKKSRCCLEGKVVTGACE